MNLRPLGYELRRSPSQHFREIPHVASDLCLCVPFHLSRVMRSAEFWSVWDAFWDASVVAAAGVWA